MPTRNNGAGPDAPELTELTTEERLARLEWCAVEQKLQIQRCAVAMAGLLAQAAQPQIQQSIVAQLLG